MRWRRKAARVGCFAWLAGSLPAALAAQTGADSLRMEVLDGTQTQADTLVLAAQNLAPFRTQVLLLDGPLQAGTDYWIDPLRGRLVLAPVFRGRTLTVRYRVLAGPPPPAGPQALRQLPRPQTLAELAAAARSPDSPAGLPPDTLLETLEAQGQGAFLEPSRLQRSGSISRAVTVGTNRDLGVNSDFRLQLSGLIGGDIEVDAALTDENIPIQPSGATQQLTDFDRIFIQLKRGKESAAFGDLEVIQRGSRFADIYRNVQGLRLAHQGPRHRYEVYGASSKGKFTTQSFIGENGRQGPYRLQGREGEPFIIVLAGSERVYLNGRLLQRGEDRDYVIEYNTGEITFTPANLIDVNTRIVVDYEYAERNFARSLVFGRYNGLVANDRLALRFSYGREADDPDAPLDLNLDRDDLQQLANVDGRAGAGRISGVDSVGFDPQQVRYLRTDTTVAGQFYAGILVRSTDPLRAVYRVAFSYVGPNQGDYVLDTARTNGATYRWVPPLNATQRGGDYAPIRQVPLPRQLQVVSLGAEYALTRNLAAYVDGAFSAQDRNRFARGGAAQQSGGAVRTGLLLRSLELSPQWKLSADVNGQYVDARYDNFDRVYPMEYGRQWNFNDLAPRGTERLTEGGIELQWREDYRLRVGGGYRAQDDSLQSRKLTVELDSRDSSTVLARNLFQYIVTQNAASGTRSSWARHNGDISRVLGDSSRRWARLGTEIWLEDRRERRAERDSLGTFAFADLRPYFRSTEGQRFTYDLTVQFRYDREFFLGETRDKSRAWKPSLALRWLPSERFSIGTTTTYYSYTLLDEAFAQQGLQSQRTLLSNIQTTYSNPDRSLSASVLYEVSSERLARREVLYVQVNPGLGQYDWIDYNGNGIQELNEFEPTANPLLANFIRVLAPTTSLLPVNRLTLGGNLRFDLKPLVRGSGGLARLARNLSGLTTVRLEQRRNDSTDRLGNYLIRFDRFAAADTNLVSAIANLRQDLFLWRNNPRGDAALSFQQARSLQFLNSGSEERAALTWAFRGRLNLDEVRSLENLVQIGTRRSRAEQFRSRNYDIRFWSVAPAMNFQFGRKVRLTGGVEYREKSSTGAAESFTADLQTYKVNLESKLNFRQRNSLFVKLELLDNRLSGMPEGTLRFDLLESLQPGRNAVWNVLLVQYLSRILELSVVYDGRAAAKVPVLHSARFQVKAIF